MKVGDRVWVWRGGSKIVEGVIATVKRYGNEEIHTDWHYQFRTSSDGPLMDAPTAKIHTSHGACIAYALAALVEHANKADAALRGAEYRSNTARQRLAAARKAFHG